MSPRSLHLAILFGCLSLLVGIVSAQQQTAPKPYTTWRTMGGMADSANYSALKQINRSNVGKLQVAWTYRLGRSGSLLLAPIVVDRTLYGAAKTAASSRSMRRPARNCGCTSSRRQRAVAAEPEESAHIAV